MSTHLDEWIGVAEVAAELKISERAAWEVVRRLKVPMIEAGRGVMANTRFRRSDWEAARDGSLKPAVPRQSRPLATTGAHPPTPKKKAAVVADKLAKLRGAS